MSHPEQFGMEKGEAGKQQKLKDGDLPGKWGRKDGAVESSELSLT